MTPLQAADRRRTVAIRNALREIQPTVCCRRLARVRAECGDSVPRMLERLVSDGHSNFEISRRMGIGYNTVKRDRERWGI